MRSISILLCLFILTSCAKKNKDLSAIEIPVGPKLLVGNEGNYQLGNASLDLYDINSNEVHHQAFNSQNQEAIGDVVQSIGRYRDEIFVVVNNSAKIEVLDLNLNKKTSITGFHSPRYMAFYQDQAFVSELYQNQLRVIDLSSHQITQSIAIPTWVEKLSIKDSLLFCSSMNDNTLRILNMNTLQWQHSITLRKEFDHVAIHQNQLYALCNGNSTDNAVLYQINSTSLQLEDSLALPFTNANNLCTGENGLYFLAGGNIQTTDFNLNSVSVFHSGQNRNFYSLHFDPGSSLLLVSDVKDYIQRGNVTSFYENGNIVFNFEAGIIPSSFLIYTN